MFPISHPGKGFCRHSPDPGLALPGWNSSAHSAGKTHWPSKSPKCWAENPWASAALLQLGFLSNTFPLSTKSCLAAGPASPMAAGTYLQILFQRAAALLWRAFPLSFSWSSHSLKKLHKALKNFFWDSFVMKLQFDSSQPWDIWSFPVRSSGVFLVLFLTAISHNGKKY